MKNLFKALAEFQQEVPVIHKGTQGYGYSYADLPTIFQVINPLMKKHGLGFTQNLGTKDGITHLSTIIFHVETGEMMESSCEVPRIQLAKMNDYQSFGSGITYFRRYCLAASLCLVTDVDNDASGEQLRTKKPFPNERFETGMNMVFKGEITKDQFVKAINGFTLTPEQTKQIEAL
jgi:hypothetical protein